MKKLLTFLILFLGTFLYLSAQTPTIRFTDTLEVPVGADTIKVIDLYEAARVKKGEAIAILIDYRTANAADGICDLGYTYDDLGTLLAGWDDDALPATLSDSVLHVEKFYITASHVFLKLTKNSLTSGLKFPVHLIK